MKIHISTSKTSNLSGPVKYPKAMFEQIISWSISQVLSYCVDRATSDSYVSALETVIKKLKREFSLKTISRDFTKTSLLEVKTDLSGLESYTRRAPETPSNLAVLIDWAGTMTKFDDKDTKAFFKPIKDNPHYGYIIVISPKPFISAMSKQHDTEPAAMFILLLDDLISDIKHELRHYVQAAVLSQIKGFAPQMVNNKSATTSKIAYNTSPVEFGPLLLSNVDHFVRALKLSKVLGVKVDFDIAVKKFTGEQRSTFSDTFPTQEFFSILKKHKPAAYKLAVGKFKKRVEEFRTLLD